MELIIPPKMIELGRQLGANIPATMEVDEQGPLLDLAEDLSPGADADFGFSLGSMVKKMAQAPKKIVSAAIKKAPPKVAGGAVKVKAPVTVAFGIKSSAMPMQKAMAAADKLLRDPNIANAKTVVKNTQALAALGDPAAKRGIITLQAVSAIRTQKNAKPGQAVIPTAAPAARTVTVQKTTAQVKRMATKVAAAPPKKEGVIKRIITWFKTTF